MLAVRIASIEIRNLKNVGYAKLDLLNKKYRSSVLGLFGQNGSGKTTLIEAIAILKTLMCGLSLNAQKVALIRQGSSGASLAFDFLLSELEISQQRYRVSYSFDIQVEETTDPNNGQLIKVPAIINEKLEYRTYQTDADDEIVKTSRKKLILDTGRKDIATTAILQQLRSPSVKEKYKLNDIRILTHARGQSFIFNRDICDIFKLLIKDSSINEIVDSLQYFARYGLYCIGNTELNLLSTEIMLVHLKKKINKNKIINATPIILNSEVKVPLNFVASFNSILNSINTVLTELVPGMRIVVETIGQTTDAQGNRFCRMAVFSQRGKIKVALQLESAGIKKIITILQLLIYAYNSKNITIAIDELDAGIFEYLLGEILSIFSSAGKGQLIFTAHNLRPLETMDKLFVAFTTVNENNRYVRVSNIKKNNNLRDTYYRDIQILSGEDAYYDATNPSKIQLAFALAGRVE